MQLGALKLGLRAVGLRKKKSFEHVCIVSALVIEYFKIPLV